MLKSCYLCDEKDPIPKKINFDEIELIINNGTKKDAEYLKTHLYSDPYKECQLVAVINAKKGRKGLRKKGMKAGNKTNSTRGC